MHRRSLVVGIVIGGVLTRPARCGAGSDFPQALVRTDGNRYTAGIRWPLSRSVGFGRKA